MQRWPFLALPECPGGRKTTRLTLPNPPSSSLSSLSVIKWKHSKNIFLMNTDQLNDKTTTSLIHGNLLFKRMNRSGHVGSSEMYRSHQRKRKQWATGMDSTWFCWKFIFVQSNIKPTLNMLIAVRAHHSSKSDNYSKWTKYLVTSRRLARIFVLIRQCRKVNLVSSIADSPGWWVGVSGAIINRKYFKQVVINPWSESMHPEDLCRGVKPVICSAIWSCSRCLLFVTDENFSGVDLRLYRNTSRVDCLWLHVSRGAGHRTINGNSKTLVRLKMCRRWLAVEWWRTLQPFQRRQHVKSNTFLCCPYQHAPPISNMPICVI